MNPRPFPAGFVWGAATSAYQIEGSPLADGAGVSNWHRFTHNPGRVANGDTGDLACDHYNRMADDVRLMRELGLQAYRFSISWSRVIPEGAGRVNQKGLDFYRRLVDALAQNGIRPIATLYHWDLPAALDDRGGWLNPDIASWFSEYASTVFRALDDRVEWWATLNEPWVVTDGGYLHGVLAPGHRDIFETAIASHNLLRAHAAAVDAYRANGKHEIGIVMNLEPKYPASNSAEDAEATKRSNTYMNEQYLDPVFKGRAAPGFAEMFGAAWPVLPSNAFDDIRRPIDFLGINYYTRGVMQNDPAAPLERASRVHQPHATHTETAWEVFPQGLTDILVWVKERYGEVPIYITENGAAFYDPHTAEDGRIDDPLRISYLKKHLGALRDAIDKGVDVRGYFVWSLLDNFEWSHGFSKRFGIVHVDYGTQKRTVKESGKYYAAVIRENGV